MTIYEKLFQYYPHHRVGFQYEFDCITQDDTEVKRHQTLCKIDSGFEFKEPEGGGDYTTKSIKPTTDDANKEPKIGMSYERVYDPPYALLRYLSEKAHSFRDGMKANTFSFLACYSLSANI